MYMLRAIDAGETLKHYRSAAGLSQMALAVMVGVTLPAVSGWERNLYRPRRPTAQRLDDALRGKGAILTAFGYAPLPSAAEMASSWPDDRMHRLEQLVAQLSNRLHNVEETVGGAGASTGRPTTR